MKSFRRNLPQSAEKPAFYLPFGGKLRSNGGGKWKKIPPPPYIDPMGS